MHIEVYGCCFSRLNIQTVDCLNNKRQREKHHTTYIDSRGRWLADELTKFETKTVRNKKQKCYDWNDKNTDVINAIIMEGGRHCTDILISKFQRHEM